MLICSSEIYNCMIDDVWISLNTKPLLHAKYKTGSGLDAIFLCKIPLLARSSSRATIGHLVYNYIVCKLYKGGSEVSLWKT